MINAHKSKDKWPQKLTSYLLLSTLTNCGFFFWSITIYKHLLDATRNHQNEELPDNSNAYQDVNDDDAFSVISSNIDELVLPSMGSLTENMTVAEQMQYEQDKNIGRMNYMCK